MVFIYHCFFIKFEVYRTVAFQNARLCAITIFMLTGQPYTDQELLEQLKAGSKDAFTDLYNRYSDKLYSFITAYTRSEAMAQDLVHDVFLKLWERRESLGEVRGFENYLYGAIRNSGITQMRRFAKQQIVLAAITGQPSSAPETPETRFILGEIQGKVHEAIQQLPPRQKEVYTLHRQGGLKQEDIAQQLNISLSTVQNHFLQAKTNIRNYLDVHYPEADRKSVV